MKIVIKKEIFPGLGLAFIFDRPWNEFILILLCLKLEISLEFL